jgi:NhaP-type Na+/H+ or K+/H+ antiporter
VLVLATMAAVAIVIHAVVPGLPWAASFGLFGLGWSGCDA